MFWYDGTLTEKESVEFALNDPGVIYGATLFTTLRVYGNDLDHPLTQWQAHCDRLCDSLEAFDWVSPNWKRLRVGAQTLKESYPVLRITLFPDGREWITGRYLPADLSDRQQQGISAWVTNALSYQRYLPSHKTGNYLGAWLALQQAQKQGVQEAILINEQGEWLETSTGNLWGWSDGSWWTPAVAKGILPGIMRSHLISSLKQQSIPVRETVWDATLVEKLEAIAYSNSVIEIIPFHTILLPNAVLSLNPSHPAFGTLRQSFAIQ